MRLQRRPTHARPTNQRVGDHIACEHGDKQHWVIFERLVDGFDHVLSHFQHDFVPGFLRFAHISRKMHDRFRFRNFLFLAGREI